MVKNMKSFIVLIGLCCTVGSMLPDKISRKHALNLAEAQLKSYVQLSSADVHNLLNGIGRGIRTPTIEENTLQNIIDKALENHMLTATKTQSCPPTRTDEKGKKEEQKKHHKEIRVKNNKPLSFLRPDAKDLHGVPASLRDSVYYLKVAQQEENQCGYLALYNAKALDDILKTPKLYEFKGMQIDSKRIDDKAQAASKQFGMEECQLEADFVAGLANMVALSKPAYIVLYDRKMNRLAFVSSSKDAPNMTETFQALKTGPFNYAYFICNTGAHWTLATVIRAPNEKPYIVYMDSMNEPLKPDGQAFELLQALSSAVGI